MPINIQDNLPAYNTLINENIFVMTPSRAMHQDIRPLKLGILNLMPTKIETETQLFRLLSNTSLQVDIDLIQDSSHIPKNISQEHLNTFYKKFDDVKSNCYDGFIITGAPVERLNFSEVNYWDELCDIFEWTKTHVYSTLHICWGAQAALYYHFGIHNHIMNTKLFGIFEHKAVVENHPLLIGFDDIFNIPHSRYTDIYREDIENCSELDLLAYSDKAGVAIVADKHNRRFFFSGHSEYDRDTLKKEYQRDLERGMKPRIPENYFPDDNPEKIPLCSWKCASSLLFSNWLNFCVYQNTPYNLNNLEPIK